MAESIRRPDFLFIGPDKTGSTWLYKILRQHPECYVPAIKDIYFFDRNYYRGFDWYLSYFKGAPADARAVGELSHDYLFSRQAADRIARDLPAVKILTCLRDPVDRTFSHYLFLIRSGRTRLPFENALVRFPELVENSLYAKHLYMYLTLFPAEQVKVMMFDRLTANPAAFAAEIFQFLGVRFIEGLPYSSRSLGAARPRSYGLARAAKLGANVARRLGLLNLVGLVKQSRWTQKALYRPYKQEEKPNVDPATVDRLRERFRSDIQDLQALLNQDFSHWLSDRADSEGRDG